MNAGSIGTFLAHLWHHGMISVLSEAASPKLDMSIEGMRSQQFSVGVFFFMLLGVLVFSGIIYAVAFGRYAPKSMKLGEKIMFGAIIFGTVLAVVFGGLQLLTGELF
ncbi:MAG TPA: hypothetical protein VIU46_01510 [Gallionellaceae bacterium]